jgi:ABC-2 type transport system ATP-binding protein
MIEIKNISKTYSGKVKAVNKLSITVEDGEIIGFIGPNGAGKTTTLKMMTGILNPDEGEILLNGINIQTNPIEAKRQFGFVPDNPDIFLRLKGIEYLNFMADIYDVKDEDRRERISRIANIFQMTSALNDTILSYSHGMRQKIVMMGVLVHSPNIWILDEPLTGLDPQSAYALKEMMREHVAQNKTVFFSTHVLEVAEKLCSKVAIINKGELFYFGTLESLKQQYPGLSLEDIFLKVTDHE